MLTNVSSCTLFSSNRIYSGIAYINAFLFNWSYNIDFSRRSSCQTLNVGLVVLAKVCGLVEFNLGVGKTKLPVNCDTLYDSFGI